MLNRDIPLNCTDEDKSLLFNSNEMVIKDQLKSMLIEAIINYVPKGYDEAEWLEYRPTVFEFPYIVTELDPFNSESKVTENLLLIEEDPNFVTLGLMWADHYTGDESVKYLGSFDISKDKIETSALEIVERYYLHKEQTIDCTDTIFFKNI